ncbi:hypothetical protein [Nocardioides plantarum]|uniref:Uncharacterized protein n=1 Tax=Nocardioides plantarum TaxID=29299 RepID=A0ABV5KA57_9ACTN|nr:hypothetical protein [Nocardioides plantarum]
MSGGPSEQEPVETPETAAQRRRRIEAVFGDVLPDTTSDERDHEAPDSGSRGDEWLRAQVPPHHG